MRGIVLQRSAIDKARQVFTKLVMPALITLPDVFNASWARLNRPQGWMSLRHRLTRSPDPTGTASKPEVGRIFPEASSGWLLVPSRNWVAINAVQQSTHDKSKKNMTSLHLRKSIDRSPLRLGFTVVLLVLAFFALPRTTPAVTLAPDEATPIQNSDIS